MEQGEWAELAVIYPFFYSQNNKIYQQEKAKPKFKQSLCKVRDHFEDCLLVKTYHILTSKGRQKNIHKPFISH